MSTDADTPMLAKSRWRSIARFNDAVLARCNFVWVLQLDGWEWSRGIAHELELAEEIGIPIRMVQP